MTDLLLSSTWFGFLLSTGTFFLAKAVNRRCGRERINPLLFATVVCGLVIIISGMDYDVYYQGAQYLDVLLTPATICLAIPLYRQFELLKKNIPAVAAGCLTGVVAHMVGCILMLVLFQLEAEEFITLLPKSITTAIGKGLSEELGGYASITMATIMLTGIFGTVIAPPFLRLTGAWPSVPAPTPPAPPGRWRWERSRVPPAVWLLWSPAFLPSLPLPFWPIWPSDIASL